MKKVYSFQNKLYLCVTKANNMTTNNLSEVQTNELAYFADNNVIPAFNDESYIGWACRFITASGLDVKKFTPKEVKKMAIKLRPFIDNSLNKPVLSGINLF